MINIRQRYLRADQAGRFWGYMIYGKSTSLKSCWDPLTRHVNICNNPCGDYFTGKGSN